MNDDPDHGDRVAVDDGVALEALSSGHDRAQTFARYGGRHHVADRFHQRRQSLGAPQNAGNDEHEEQIAVRDRGADEQARAQSGDQHSVRHGAVGLQQQQRDRVPERAMVRDVEQVDRHQHHQNRAGGREDEAREQMREDQLVAGQTDALVTVEHLVGYFADQTEHRQSVGNRIGQDDQKSRC